MFEQFNLTPKLLRAIKAQSWDKPTEVQQQALTPALAGADLLVSAETGSGKTAVYIIPLLQKILINPQPKSGTRALILVPTRELALQVKKDCDALCKFTSIKSMIARGGQEFLYQASLLRRNPEIVIATPGRLSEHLKKRTADLCDVDTVVLDECDRMLDMGFRDEVLAITKHCTQAHQSLLLSATMKHKGVAAIAASLLNEPTFIQIKSEKLQENIRQQIIFSDDNQHKEKLTHHLLTTQTYTKSIVFTKTRAQAGQLANLLRYHKLRVDSLHGEVPQDMRNKIMSKFRQGSIDIIVATDLAARGLDVSGVDLIINFDMAQSGDEHVHRVGRTGRAGESGLAICLINTFDYSLMSSIERYLKIRFERRIIDSLKAKYTGPKKLKTNGKPFGTKKKTTASKIKSKQPINKPPSKSARLRRTFSHS